MSRNQLSAAAVLLLVMCGLVLQQSSAHEVVEHTAANPIRRLLGSNFFGHSFGLGTGGGGAYASAYAGSGYSGAYGPYYNDPYYADPYYNRP